MHNSKLTVLMAVYNNQRYLRKAIESILNQIFKDFEFIIINDASEDSSKEIILSYNDSRIVYIENSQNLGLTKSLIKGLNMARGKYIARMDADDISYPERLNMQLGVLETNQNISVVGCHYEVIDETDRVFAKNGFVNDIRVIKKLLEGGENPLVHGSTMFIKEDILSIGGYNEKFYYAQDFELWSRAIKKFFFHIIEKPLYQLRSFSKLDKDKYIFQKFYRDYVAKNCEDTSFVPMPSEPMLTAEFSRLSEILPKYYTSNYYLWTAKANILNDPLYAIRSLYKSFRYAYGFAGKKFLFTKSVDFLMRKV